MRRTFLLLALPMVLAVAPAPAATPDAGRTLRALGREWQAHLRRQRPHDAERWGLGGPGVALPVTRAWIDGERAWVSAFAARLEALPAAGLDPRRAAERDTLAARCSELVDSDVTRRAWDREPAMYATLAVDAVREALGRHDACGRARHATKRLRVVPELLRDARVRLAAAPSGAAAAGIARFEEALALYREELPARTADCRDAYAQAGLAEADSSAVRAVAGFLVFLREDLAPRAR
jgi:hypothetical protein